MNVQWALDKYRKIAADCRGEVMKRAARPTALRFRIMIDFLIVIVGLTLCVFLLGNYVLRKEVVERIQMQVKNNLKAVRSVYYHQLETLQIGLDLIDEMNDVPRLKEKLALDYLFIVPVENKETVKSEIVQAAFEGNAVGGTRLIGLEEMRTIGLAPARKAPVPIKETPLARPSEKKQLDQLMAIEYARPIYEQGAVIKVIYGGKVLNRNFELIDFMHELVFDNQFYNKKPVGTVTIFQYDVRIATNVLDKTGSRAIGTRVSEIVYDNVIGKGETWIDRAFVVTDWYVTAYEPIYDIAGKRIGILYVGTLEALFKDKAAQIWKLFSQIILGVILLGIVIAVVLTGVIIKPLEEIIGVTHKISHGDLQCRVKTDSVIKEFNTLGAAFNNMADKVQERDRSLTVSHTKITNLNRSYLDMINFVTHEIKGMLSSVMMSTHSLKDGGLGDVNTTQKKTLASIARNLDYFAATVKNFFDLSRIEKGEMVIEKRRIDSCREIIDASIQNFQKLAQDKGITIKEETEEPLVFEADGDLLQMAVNNLVGNAVKYGAHGGTILIQSRKEAEYVAISVINDGEPIPEEERAKLFRKFSRLDTEATRSAKGTGLGLFITEEIIRRHNGTIKYVPHDGRNEFVMRIPLKT